MTDKISAIAAYRQFNHQDDLQSMFGANGNGCGINAPEMNNNDCFGNDNG